MAITDVRQVRVTLAQVWVVDQDWVAWALLEPLASAVRAVLDAQYNQLDAWLDAGIAVGSREWQTAIYHRTKLALAQLVECAGPLQRRNRGVVSQPQCTLPFRSSVPPVLP